MDYRSNNVELCDFRCRQGTQCVPNWRVCDGSLDCDDHSDEAGCPQVAALVQPSPNPVAKPYADNMQEISDVQICIVAVALVLTLLLITCVINHYKQFGVRSWGSDQRRQKSKRSATPSVLYSPAKVDERIRRDTLLLQEHQLRMLSVQRDFELNYPVQVRRPPEEEYYQRSHPQHEEHVPKVYVKPPPNRTVTLKDRCIIPQIPPHQVHKMRPAPEESERHTLVTVPLDYAPERWQPPGRESCSVELSKES